MVILELIHDKKADWGRVKPLLEGLHLLDYKTNAGHSKPKRRGMLMDGGRKKLVSLASPYFFLGSGPIGDS